jgi:acyl carrier protein
MPGLRETEERIGRIWSQVLEVDHTRACDDFFELGGSSVDAMVMLKMVEADLSAQVTLQTFYDQPTLGGLVDQARLSVNEQATTEEIR